MGFNLLDYIVQLSFSFYVLKIFNFFFIFYNLAFIICCFLLTCSTITILLSPGKQVIYKRKIFFTGNLENYTNKILFAHSKGYFREFSSFLQCTNLLLVKVSYLNKFKLFYQIYIRLSKVYIE